MAGSKPRLLLIDDGDNYANIIMSQMPEFELIHPDPDRKMPCIPDGPSAIYFLEHHSGRIDTVLLDMHFDVPPERLFQLGEGASPRRTKRFQGVAILREIRARFPNLPVVLLTALEDLSLVDAAGDLVSQSMTYVLDGHDLDTLRVRIHSAMGDAAQAVEDSQILWGADTSMKSLRRRLSVLARGKMPVILEGETGTGKSYLAERFVHAHSGRTGPFVVLDLSTLPKDLIPAHLFGSVKGAYTGSVESRKGVFEIANQGTLFIDEIQNAPLEVQKQLLLVLQEGRVRPLGASREIMVDVKVIAASNKPLDEAVKSGQFRPDLYMRLSPATRLRIPPLRERPDDLLFLACRFATKAGFDPDVGALRDQIAKAVGLSGGTPLELTIGRGTKRETHRSSIEIAIPKPAWKMMENHPWPGNIRELEMLIHNVVTFTLVATVDAIERGISISSSKLQVDPGLIGELLLGAGILLDSSAQSPQSSSPARPGQVTVHIEPADTLNGVANDVERQYFLELFAQCNRDFNQMAYRLLGDSQKGRAVRLRFNQLGLKVREIHGA